MGKQKTNGFLASKKEHFSYGIYFFGQNFLWALAGLVSTFLTDIGIGATVVALVILIPKVWDAVNDTLFGIIVDKVKFKNGQKFLPWVRIGTVAIGITTILMFAIPASMSDALKIAFFIGAYLIFDLAYTMLDAPVFALPVAATSNIQERTSLLSKGRFFAMLGGMVSMLAIPIMRPMLGWFMTAVVVVVISVLFMLPLIIFGKERHSESQMKEPTISFKQMGKYLITNKYLAIILGVMLLVGVTTVQQPLAIYVARICFQSEQMATIMGLVIVVPVLIVAGFIPMLTKKFDKFTIFVVGLFMSAGFSLVLFFVGFDNLIVTMIFMALSSVGLAIYQVVGYMFIADCVEYGTYKTGTRASGISFSLQTFVSKLKGALVVSLALFVLGMFGFVSGENAIQPEGVDQSVWGVFTLFPVIGYTIAGVLMLLFYKLRDKEVQVMAKFNNNETSLEEADSVLAAKYGTAIHSNSIEH